MANAVTPYSDGQIWDDQDANWSVGFGDGTDGAFSETSGTTNLVQGTVYQYTSFLLDSSATLSASSASAKPIIIFVQGNCTINGAISLTVKGGQGADGIYSTNGATGSGSNATGGLNALDFMNFKQSQKSFVVNGTSGGTGGSGAGNSGGGGGASPLSDGSSTSPPGGGGAPGSGGTGGVGGCTILLIIGGTLTFGASSTIDVSGGNGGNGTNDAGGGGGGGSGDILIFHNGTKTDNGVTTDVTAGSGGTSAGGGGTGGNGATGTEKIAAYSTILW